MPPAPTSGWRPGTCPHTKGSYPEPACKGTANKALAVVGEVKGAAWAVRELEGKGKPRKDPWGLGGLHAGPLIGTPTDSKGFGCPEALREGSGS